MSKLPNVGTTIFSVMSKLATDNNAINLAQGFPNFPVDEQLTTILEGISNDPVHQYAPMAGNSALLHKIGQLIETSYGRQNIPEKELLVTAGATQGIFTILQALAGNGDEVIILDPSYDCYEPAVILCGAQPVRIGLKVDFTPDWDLVERTMNNKTKILIINNPHNPSGKVFTENDLVQLETILAKFPDVILLSDEVYEFITFENKHISVNSRKNLLERSVIVSSFGKTFHITGWKVGYLIAPEKLMEEIKKVHQFLVFSVNSVAQAVLSKYLDKVEVSKLGSFYQEKRDLFKNLMEKSRFDFLPSEGTYFQLASYSGISSENDLDFCKRMVIEYGVAAIPLSVFNADKRDLNLIRFCFAKDAETLTKAAEKLCRI